MNNILCNYVMDEHFCYSVVCYQVAVVDTGRKAFDRKLSITHRRVLAPKYFFEQTHTRTYCLRISF